MQEKQQKYADVLENQLKAIILVILSHLFFYFENSIKNENGSVIKRNMFQMKKLTSGLNNTFLIKIGSGSQFSWILITKKIH